MNKYELFEKFNITDAEQINTIEFIINALIIVILAFVLEFTYRKCAKSISNKRMFAANFILIAFTTMLIITIVKSSLALSLGLVGALSIVRFRSAIKEPEELAYLFLTIAVGLGLGANQRNITIIAFMIIVLILWIRHLISHKSEDQNLYFTITTPAGNLTMEKILNEVKSVFGKAEVKRFDKNPEILEMSLLVDSKKPELIQQCSEKLEKLDKGIHITFIDNKSY